MAKLPPFLKDQSVESYTHLKTTKNLDFKPQQVHLCRHTLGVFDRYSELFRGDILIYDTTAIFLFTTRWRGATPQVHLTLSNAKDKKAWTRGVDVLVSDVATIKEYSCVEGLVAVDKAAMGDLPKIHEMMLKVKEDGLWSKPVFT